MRSRSLLVSLGLAAVIAGCRSGDGGQQSATQTPALAPPEIAHLSEGIVIEGDPMRPTVFGRNLRDPSIKETSTTDGPVFRFMRTRDLDGSPTEGPEASRVATVYPLAGNAAEAWIDADPPVLPTGAYSFTLRTSAGLEVHREDALLVLPRPRVTSVDPEAQCIRTSPSPDTPRSETIALIGSAIHRLLPYEPRVSFFLKDASGVFRPYRTATAQSISGCRALTINGAESCFLSTFGLLCQPIERVELCTRIDAHLPAYVTAHMGVGIELPLREAAAGDETFRAFFIEEPDTSAAEFLGIRTVVDGPLDLQIWRADWPLLYGPAAQPTVLLDGAPFPVTGSGCESTGVPGKNVCAGLNATVPQGYAAGRHLFEVTTVSGCTASSFVDLAPRPDVNAVVPPYVCAVGLQSVRIEGTGFFAASAIVDGQDQSAFTCRASTPGRDCIGFVLSGRALLPIGTHSIAVKNQSSPALLSNGVTLTVTPGPPIVGAPSPHLIYSGATRTVFVPVSNLTGRVISATLSTGPQSVPVAFAEVAEGVELQTPALGGSALYDIEIADESGCAGRGTGLFTVSDAVIVLRDFEMGAEASSTISTGSDWPATPRWQASGGNPGGLFTAQRSEPGSDWYFSVPLSWAPGSDLGLVRFDLSASADGEPSSSPGFLLKNAAFQLEHRIGAPAPDGAWTRYELSLQSPYGWTYTDGTETRPARAEDLAATFDTVLILGSWATGATQASVDNVAVELAR